MISEKEVKIISREQGVPLSYVEKDYVMGWLLWAISNNLLFSNNLVLKGGNCIRKIYLPQTRFSDDLDFTAKSHISLEVLKSNIDKICVNTSKASGIEFHLDNTNIKQKEVVDKDCTAYDARVYFKGFAGDSSMKMRIKFDISEYEKIALPLQDHELIHNYSDAELCKTYLHVYSIEEILAEKLRCWIQRTRSRDLYDVVRFVKDKPIPFSYRNILKAFLSKTIFKEILLSGKEEILQNSKFDIIRDKWINTIICPKNSILLFKNSIELFTDFIAAVFNTDIITELGLSKNLNTRILCVIPPEIREPIIEGGKARKLLSLKYKSIDRTIEPYSFRYKKGREYFYGYDRSRGNTIKSFILQRVQSVSIMPNEFEPRWVVEF